jgi:guanine nucleotide-binding protein subunit alpha
MDLWGGVVRNEMLGNAPLVLIHNKINLLREKLEAGTKVVEHVVSFKDRSNDVETVVQCRFSLS